MPGQDSSRGPDPRSERSQLSQEQHQSPPRRRRQQEGKRDTRMFFPLPRRGRPGSRSRGSTSACSASKRNAGRAACTRPAFPDYEARVGPAKQVVERLLDDTDVASMCPDAGADRISDPGVLAPDWTWMFRALCQHSAPAVSSAVTGQSLVEQVASPTVTVIAAPGGGPFR
jgi:hypothetical protein